MKKGWHCTLAGLVIAVSPGIAVFAVSQESLPDSLTAGWQGAAVCELIQEDATSRMLRCTFPPGIGHERHFHPPHLGYVLAGGTMRITDGDGTRKATVPTGGGWQSDGVHWHEALNVGDTTTQYLIIEEKQ